MAIDSDVGLAALARIDANRIVSYYDFDGRGNPIRKPIGSVETAEDEEIQHFLTQTAWEKHGENMEKSHEIVWQPWKSDDNCRSFADLWCDVYIFLHVPIYIAIWEYMPRRQRHVDSFRRK